MSKNKKNNISLHNRTNSTGCQTNNISNYYTKKSTMNSSMYSIPKLSNNMITLYNMGNKSNRTTPFKVEDLSGMLVKNESELNCIDSGSVSILADNHNESSTPVMNILPLLNLKSSCKNISNIRKDFLAAQGIRPGLSSRAAKLISLSGRQPLKSKTTMSSLNNSPRNSNKENTDNDRNNILEKNKKDYLRRKHNDNDKLFLKKILKGKLVKIIHQALVMSNDEAELFVSYLFFKK
jgi:hypothetical protein